MLAGATPVLVHNCNVALGWQNGGKLDAWASENKFTTFSNMAASDFAYAARKAIADPNATLHVNRTGFGDFMEAAQRGLHSGEAGFATDLEMSYIAQALANGQRSWNSIKWYSPNGAGGVTLDAATAMPDLSTLRGALPPLKGGVFPHCNC